MLKYLLRMMQGCDMPVLTSCHFCLTPTRQPIASRRQVRKSTQKKGMQRSEFKWRQNSEWFSRMKWHRRKTTHFSLLHQLVGLYSMTVILSNYVKIMQQCGVIYDRLACKSFPRRDDVISVAIEAESLHRMLVYIPHATMTGVYKCHGNKDIGDKCKCVEGSLLHSVQQCRSLCIL